jgi:inward rectifier potassium channel
MMKTKDPGLGSNFESKVGRMINEDGTYNIRRVGGLTGVRDIYKFLIELSWLRFIVLAFGTYVLINLLFALIYVLVGIEQLKGTDPAHSDILNAFFFSVQTLTTIGYGHIAPSGLTANLVAVVESFVGLLSFALITGLLYGRFSRPSSKILFTRHILLTPHGDGKALMFKIVNQRNSTLLNASAKVLLTMDKGPESKDTMKEYFRLPLQIDNIHFFPLTWTILHEINEDSPLYGLSLEDLKNRNCEVIALIEAFDETHHQSIYERRSYAGDQWLENRKFARNFGSNAKGELELRIHELDNLEAL